MLYIETTSESAPVFTFRPENKSENISATVFFECTARGIPIPGISWVKYAENGAVTEIRNGGRFIVSSMSGHLVISRVQWADEGRYSCTAQNKHGKIVADAFLTIITCKYTTNVVNVTFKVKRVPSTLYKIALMEAIGVAFFFFTLTIIIFQK